MGNPSPPIKKDPLNFDSECIAFQAADRKEAHSKYTIECGLVSWWWLTPSLLLPWNRLEKQSILLKIENAEDRNERLYRFFLVSGEVHLILQKSRSHLPELCNPSSQPCQISVDTLASPFYFILFFFIRTQFGKGNWVRRFNYFLFK